jgi:UDP-N-acetylglucosamine transferase subunit ALG13
LQILTGNQQLLDKLAMKANYFFINRFTECWVPDVSGEMNLAGLLSHPKKLPKVPVKYIGNLSRFNLQNSPITIPLTILISGPEPQRTIFEELMVKQSEEFDMPVFIIRGLPESNKTLTTSNKNLQYRNHLAAAELSLILQQSEMIIARSGYSTVMDLLALQKKAILIPTPGQTEQEYLAKKLSKERLFFSVSQHEFNFKKNLEAVASFQFQNETFSSALKEVIEKWKDSIN